MWFPCIYSFQYLFCSSFWILHSSVFQYCTRNCHIVKKKCIVIHTDDEQWWNDRYDIQASRICFFNNILSTQRIVSPCFVPRLRKKITREKKCLLKLNSLITLCYHYHDKHQTSKCISVHSCCSGYMNYAQMN